MTAEIPELASGLETGRREHRYNLRPLARSDFHDDMAAGHKMGSRPQGNGAVGIKAVFPAVQGQARVEAANIRAQPGNVRGWDIGRV